MAERSESSESLCIIGIGHCRYWLAKDGLNRMPKYVCKEGTVARQWKATHQRGCEQCWKEFEALIPFEDCSVFDREKSKSRNRKHQWNSLRPNWSLQNPKRLRRNGAIVSDALQSSRDYNIYLVRDFCLKILVRQMNVPAVTIF